MGATFTKRGGAYRVAVHHAGKREYKTVRSLADAKALVQQIHKMELAGVSVIESIQKARTVTPTVTYPRLKDALPQWIAGRALSRDIRQSTSKMYRSRCRVWLNPHVLPDGRVLGDLPINVITREMIGSAIRAIKEAGRSLTVVKQVVNPLRSFYADLIETKVLVGPSPALDLRHFIGQMPERISARPKYFTPKEGAVLVAAVRSLYPRWHAFVLTGLLGGLRWGESAGLMRSDIDWERARVHVQRTASAGGTLEPPKNGKSRHVKLSAELLRALRAQVETVALEAGVKEWTPEEKQLIFPNTKGRVASYKHFVEDVWQPLLRKAGLPYRKYHSVRHSYATWMLEGGADLRYVQKMLGHASIKMTSDVYGHIASETHEHHVEALDQLVAGSRS